MARVTVEDCVDKVPNRFDLVLLAAQRARAISAGEALLVDRDRDKNPVVALREIADERVTPDTLREDLIQGLQRYVEGDDTEEVPAEDTPRIAARPTADAPEEQALTEEEFMRRMREDVQGLGSVGNGKDNQGL